jgi:hypothetical protein
MNQTSIAAFLGIVLAALAVQRPRYAIVATFIFLALLGDFRRYLVSEFGVVSNDPILLVGPLVAGVLFLRLVTAGRLSLASGLSKLILLLSIFMAVEMVNPLQGGLSVGVAGALFFLVPIAWFWIGQAYGSAEFLYKVLTRVVIPLSVLGALLGLCQTFFGFLRFEARWIYLAGTNGLFVGKHYRPFGFFVSPSEYAYYMTVGLVIILAPLTVRRVRPVILVAPILMLAVFLMGGRGPIVVVVFVIAVLWAAQASSRNLALVRMGVALVIGVAGLVFVLQSLQNSNFSEEVQPYVDRQTQLVSDPSKTTVGIHGEIIWLGIVDGIKNPLGSGLGITTPAAGRYGGTGHSSDFDVSNLFISLGVAGGLIYILVLLKTFHVASLYWRGMPSLLSLFILAILVAMLGQWCNGGQYSLAALVWFCIGTLDREQKSVALSAVPVARPRRQFSRSMQPAVVE